MVDLINLRKVTKSQMLPNPLYIYIYIYIYSDGKQEQGKIRTFSNMKHQQNNSYFSPKQQSGDFLLFGLNGIDKFKLDIETNELEILKPDRTSNFTKLTDGLKTLLFDRDTELNTS